MPTFAQWEAKRRGGVSAGEGAASAAPMDPNDIQDVSPDVIASAQKFVDGPHADLTPYDTDANDPTGAKLSLTKDPSRYLGHAAKGLARSPIDLVKGILGLPSQIKKGLTEDLPTLVKNPSLLSPSNIGRAATETADFANTHPDEMGSLLGQSLLAPRAPGAANAALRHGPTVVGKTMGAVGRGAEALGTSKIAKMASKFGPMEAALRMDPYGIAVAAAPKVLEVGGKALQRGGKSLEGLDLAYKGKVPFDRPAAPEVVDPADVMRDKVKGAREDVSAGFSRPVASKLNGLPRSKATDISTGTADVVSPGELFPYQSDAIRGLAEARKAAAGDNAWANDASARKPIDAFYEGDPQARIGGEGRMTGQFTEGTGGLADAAAGRLSRYPSPSEEAALNGLDPRISNLDMGAPAGSEPGPFFDEGLRSLAEFGRSTVGPLSPLDELSRASGRAKSPATMDSLLAKLGGRGQF